MIPLSDCRLYTFVDTAYLQGKDLVQVTQQLCDGGSDIIQLRSKSSTPAEIKTLAERILPITQCAGVWLVINDHPEIAHEVGAPACHLGQEDFFDSNQQREALLRDRQKLKFGISTHSPAQAEKALAANPDYIAIGPIYATPTKATAVPVTLDYVKWAASHVKIPWFAIGGITMANLDAVIAAGARRICVVSAILKAPDIRQACQEFKRRISSAA